MTTLATAEVPAFICGELIMDSAVAFAARNGKDRFHVADPATFIDRLPLRDTSRLADVHALPLEAVLDVGDRLVATAQRLEQLADLVAAHGERVQAVALDVTDAGSAEAAVETAVEAFGGPLAESVPTRTSPIGPVGPERSHLWSHSPPIASVRRVSDHR